MVLFYICSVTVLLSTEVMRLGNHHANRIIRAEKAGQAASNYSTDVYYEVYIMILSIVSC